jgi:hypothetical protein
VAHSQYAATTERARRNYFLTLLYHHLITETFADGTHRWFDFGTSNLDGGRFLDSGLLAQKYAMGGRGVAYATYSLVF